MAKLTDDQQAALADWLTCLSLKDTAAKMLDEFGVKTGRAALSRWHAAYVAPLPAAEPLLPKRRTYAELLSKKRAGGQARRSTNQLLKLNELAQFTNPHPVGS